MVVPNHSKERREIVTEICPSIFGADLLHLQDEIDFLEEENTHILHLDMCDGNFVHNMCFGGNQIKSIKSGIKNMLIDVHMMVGCPQDHLDDVIESGADMISIHYESTPHVHLMVQRIKKAGLKAGIVLNPGTPISVLEYMLDDVDYILLMSINPGAIGQSFIEKTVQKVADLKAMIGDRDILIQVDGGVDDKTAKQLKDAGADLLVVGRYLFTEPRKERYDTLRKAIA